MSLSKREFLQVMASASVAGMALGRYADASAQTAAQGLYDLPPFGNVSLLHMTDCHAQLKPIYFREPSVNLGLGSMQGQLPHLVGEHLLKLAGVRPGTAQAHAFTFLDFDKAARSYGKVGGFAHTGHAGQAAQGQPARRTAAGRRRHLAGLGHQPVDRRAGHGRRLQAAGRGRDDRPLGVHLRHGPG